MAEQEGTVSSPRQMNQFRFEVKSFHHLTHDLHLNEQDRRGKYNEHKADTFNDIEPKSQGSSLIVYIHRRKTPANRELTKTGTILGNT